MKCKSQNCNNQATAIMRTFDVCEICYEKYRRDNIDRIKKGINIPKELIALKKKVREYKNARSQQV